MTPFNTRRWRVKQRSLFHAVERQAFGASTCFLCGRRLGSKNRSDEHIFPKWLQQRFALWNEQLTLLNGTTIPYRQLTIPCCDQCNTVHLAAIERDVEIAVGAGVEAVRALPRETLFYWLGKIFYGLLYKEGLLQRHRARPRSAKIVPKSVLKSYAAHHLHLQGIRLPMMFRDFFPASILVVPCQVPRSLEDQFDFRDLSPALAVAIRMGKVGILAALQDCGAQAFGAAAHFTALEKLHHHPVQFIESTATLFYQAGLLQRTPKFLTTEGNTTAEVVHLPGLSTRPLYREWEALEFAHLLAFHTGKALEEVFRPPSVILSCIRGPAGEYRHWQLVEDSESSD